MTISIEQVQQLRHGKVVTANGNKVGSIGQVYLDDTSGEPSWVTAKTGLFGSSESFIPLQGARIDGDDVVVDYDEDTIKNAPRVDPDGHLEPDQESALYQHYRLDGIEAVSNVRGDRPSDLDDPSEVGDDRADRSAETVGQDRSGPTTDDAMTRSEEQLRVGVATRESGRARLRKYVTTEQVTQTVPVSREEVTVTREPITDDNRGDATSGPAISEEEHELTLHEEVPTVDKDVVAVERVKLGKKTVTEQATVSDEVRKEQIDMDDPRNTTR
ncbi:MAG: photosystem reaction center subunit [Friedmanniella sp.]|nr:photosystem reaction center subunit [Friedmanniella sp.]